jgi:hypothetical protein
VRLWPWSEEWDEFAWTYLSSYVSTSLADGHAAEEGSLHETEFIARRTREGKQVYLLGYIFQRKDWDDLGLDLEATLNKLQIGGERGYGWGRLSLHADCAKNPLGKNARYFEDFEFYVDDATPILKAASDQSRLLAHTIADPSVTTGEIEPLLGRLTDENAQFGHKHSEAAICWKPGSIISKGDKFVIKSKGLWQRLVK